MLKKVLPWTGTKKKIIPQLVERLPNKDILNKTKVYIEPFFGSGASLFGLIEHFPSVERIIINDFNSLVVNFYLVIKHNVEELLSEYDKMIRKALSYDGEKEYNEKKEYLNNIKKELNKKKDSITLDKIDELNVRVAALFLCCQKCAFSGSCNINKKGKYNSTIIVNRVKAPLSQQQIQDFRDLSKFFNEKNVEIYNSDYKELLKLCDNIKEPTFVYFDPPYRTYKKQQHIDYINKPFNDNDQENLINFLLKNASSTKSTQNTYCMLSNEDLGDGFFEKLSDNKFTIHNIVVLRMMGSKENRKNQSEVIITNY